MVNGNKLLALMARLLMIIQVGQYLFRQMVELSQLELLEILENLVLQSQAPFKIEIMLKKAQENLTGLRLKT